MAHPRAEHALVRLLTDSEPWPAGTVGTVVESADNLALVEIADDRGRAVDLLSLPYDSLASVSEGLA